MLAVATRRAFLLNGAATLAATACTRVMPRPTPLPTPTLRPEMDAWNGEVQAMLSDGLESLRTFDVYAAFRVSTAAVSSMRLPSSLAWDPPTGAAWDRATRVTQGLHGRADQLFEAVTRTQIDTSLWREQRALAEAAHDLADLGDALLAYGERIATLPPGDASGAISLLEKAWARWESIGARFGVSRGEHIEC